MSSGSSSRANGSGDSALAAGAAVPSQLEPLRESLRINSVDVIRGVAVLGILLMNIVPMGLPGESYDDPTVIGGDTGRNLAVWLANSLFFEGTMRGLFSALFGAGILLFTGKEADKENGVAVADAWYRRMIWAVIFGLFHAYILLWPGDILYSYGLMGMFIFPFRRVAPGRLLALGLALLLAGTAVSLIENVRTLDLHGQAVEAEQAKARNEILSNDAAAALEEWNEMVETRKPTPEAMAEPIARTQGGYLSAFWEREQVTTLFRSVFHYRYDYFDILGMMLVGMALFKWGVFQAALPRRVYAVMMVVGYAVGLLVNWREVSLIQADNFSVVSFQRAAITYDLGRFFMVAGHIGLIMLLCRSEMIPRITSRLASVGRMALTNYILHTLTTSIVFIGFAQYGRWERHELYYLVAGIWIFQLIASPIWLQYFRFGPLEWAWRALTYLRRPPFRRSR
jgi:uncharacterized protein